MRFYNTTTVKILPALNPHSPLPRTTPSPIAHIYMIHAHYNTHAFIYIIISYEIRAQWIRAARVEYEIVAFDPEHETWRTDHIMCAYNDISCNVAIILLLLCYHRSMCV